MTDFRVLKSSKREDFRAIKSSKNDDFRALKSSKRVLNFRALKSSKREDFRGLKSSKSSTESTSPFPRNFLPAHPSLRTLQAGAEDKPHPKGLVLWLPFSLFCRDNLLA